METLLVRVEDIESRTAVEHVFQRSPVRIGRSVHNDMCLPQRFVSAWHGLIDFDPAGVRYTDLGSTNGTLVNGSPVEAHCAAALESGAEVGIGSLRVTCLLDEGKGPAAEVAPEASTLGESGIRVRSSSIEPVVAPGGITAMMKKLAAVPDGDFERAWRQVLVPGGVIGRFELVREVGRGSFGVVFEARDRQLGRLVAFKAVKPGRESQVLLRQELLQKEAEAAAQLNHPNIVSLHDVGTCESGPYLIMELLKGESLRDRMRRERIPIRDALEIAIEIAWALDHAHAAGIVHRDLKPANVFLCSSGQVKVLDFGIALVFGAGARSALGTPAYMAPEQWRQAHQDARTDVFGAAAMLAEMASGSLPYRVTEEWSAVLEPGARPHLASRGIPPALAALLRRGLSANPDLRPKDGHAWLGALLDIHELLDRTQPVNVAHLANHRKAPRPAGTGELPATPLRKGRVPLYVAIALLSTVALMLAYLLVR